MRSGTSFPFFLYIHTQASCPLFFLVYGLVLCSDWGEGGEALVLRRTGPLADTHAQRTRLHARNDPSPRRHQLCDRRLRSKCNVARARQYIQVLHVGLAHERCGLASASERLRAVTVRWHVVAERSCGCVASVIAPLSSPDSPIGDGVRTSRAGLAHLRTPPVCSLSRALRLLTTRDYMCACA